MPALPTVSLFSTDEQALRKVLEGDSAVDWSSYNLIAGELRALVNGVLVN